MHTNIYYYPRLARFFSRLIAAWMCTWIMLGHAGIYTVSAASTWNPTLIVNTEAFQSIDDTDTTANIVLRFGDTINKSLTYDRSLQRFQFDDDLYIIGGLDVTGTVSGATLYGTKSLRSSGSLVFEGAASGSSLYLGTSLEGAGLVDCDTSNTSKLLWDATAKRFSCGTDQTGGSGAPEVGTTSFSGGVLRLGDPRYVNVSGDTMTGTLHIRKAISAAASGALVVDQRTNQTGAYIGTTSNQAPALVIDAAGTTTSPHIVFGYQGNFDSRLYRSTTTTLRTNASFIVDGDLTFGDALSDAITVHASTWTFNNDTNFVLSGGVNGLSFDTDTLSIDAANNRVGIGTTAPEVALDVAGTMSGKSLHITGSGANPLVTTDLTRPALRIGGSGMVLLGTRNDPDTAPLNTTALFGENLAGRATATTRTPSATWAASALQPSLFSNQIMVLATGGGTTVNGYGTTVTNDTTVSHPAASETFGYMTNFATAATSGDDAGTSSANTSWFRGSTTGANGFFFAGRVGVVDTTSIRVYAGMADQTIATMVGADNPAGNHIGFQFSTPRADTNWQFRTKDNTTANVIDTGIAFTANKVYDLMFYCEKQCTTVTWEIRNVTDDTVARGSTSSNLPTTSTALRIVLGVETQTTAARNIRMQQLYVEADR